MPVFKFVVSEGKKSYKVEKDQGDCPIIGKKIGDAMPGDFLGLEGYELIITGGHDRDGFPMKKDIEGVSRKKIITTKGIGFAGRLRRKKKRTKSREGLRKRKMMRGNTIATDVVQINCKVIKAGEKPLEELLKK